MKVTILFDLPQDQDEFHTAVLAPQYKAALWDILEALRRMLKYDEQSGEVQAALRKFAEEAHAIVMDRNLEL
jgi:hypothetical protein